MSAREIDLGEYIELPAGDRNAPLSISSGQADELDAAVVLPELRTFAPDDFFTSCDADERQAWIFSARSWRGSSWTGARRDQHTRSARGRARTRHRPGPSR
jgi:hypothetical protein